jgi:Peptidase inhibitor I78 family
MKNFIIAFVAGAALMACSPSTEPTTPAPDAVASTPAAPEPAPPVVDPANPPPDACGAAQYASLVGQPITAAGVPAEGPNVRYIRPNTQVTMDFRADRLNIDIDANEMITGFRCT